MLANEPHQMNTNHFIFLIYFVNKIIHEITQFHSFLMSLLFLLNLPAIVVVCYFYYTAWLHFLCCCQIQVNKYLFLYFCFVDSSWFKDLFLQLKESKMLKATRLSPGLRNKIALATQCCSQIRRSNCLSTQWSQLVMVYFQHIKTHEEAH